MSSSDRKRIGEHIVDRVDALVNLIMLKSHEKEEREALLSKGHGLVQELSALLEKFLGPDNQYVPQAIRELVKQRLSVDESQVTGDFFEILEEMISLKEVVPSASLSRKLMLNASPQNLGSDSLQRAITFLFPEAEILKNYRLCGVNLEYYLPSCGIAVVDEAKENGSHALKEYLCKSRGIQLIRLNTQKLNGYREIARYIKWKLR